VTPARVGRPRLSCGHRERGTAQPISRRQRASGAGHHPGRRGRACRDRSGRPTSGHGPERGRSAPSAARGRARCGEPVALAHLSPRPCRPCRGAPSRAHHAVGHRGFVGRPAHRGAEPRIDLAGGPRAATDGASPGRPRPPECPEPARRWPGPRRGHARGRRLRPPTGRGRRPARHPASAALASLRHVPPSLHHRTLPHRTPPLTATASAAGNPRTAERPGAAGDPRTIERPGAANHPAADAGRQRGHHERDHRHRSPWKQGRRYQVAAVGRAGTPWGSRFRLS
jgi:hypothetical protein